MMISEKLNSRIRNESQYGRIHTHKVMAIKISSFEEAEEVIDFYESQKFVMYDRFYNGYCDSIIERKYGWISDYPIILVNFTVKIMDLMETDDVGIREGHIKPFDINVWRFYFKNDLP